LEEQGCCIIDTAILVGYAERKDGRTYQHCCFRA